MLLLVAVLVLLLPDAPVLKTRSGRDELPSMIPRDEEAALEELATVLSVPCLRGRRAGDAVNGDDVLCLCPRSRSRLAPSAFLRLALATRELEVGSARSSRVQTTERRNPVEPTMTERGQAVSYSTGARVGLGRPWHTALT